MPVPSTLTDMGAVGDLSMRKKRQLLHEEALQANDRILDVFRCVERLHTHTDVDLRALVAKESLSATDVLVATHTAVTAATMQGLGSGGGGSSKNSAGAAAAAALAKAESAATRPYLKLGKAAGPAFADGGAGRVDVEALVRALPLHATAVLLCGDGGGGGGRGESFADRAARLTPVELTAPSAVGHAGRALRLLAALLNGIDTVPLLAPLGRVTGEAGWAGAGLEAAAAALLDAAGAGGGAGVAEGRAGGPGGDPASASAALSRGDAVPAALAALLAVAMPRKGGMVGGGGGAWGVHDAPGLGGLAPGGHGLSAARRLGIALERIVGSPRLAGPALPAVYDAVRALYRMVDAALVGGGGGASAGASPPLAASLADAAGEAMEALALLTGSPLFYAGAAARDRTLAAPLRLVAAGLALLERAVGWEATGAPPLPPATRTAVDLLAARSLALLVSLTEHDEPSFLDVVADPAAPTAGMARAVAEAALAAASRALRPPPSASAASRSAGAGQLDLAALAAAELLTDDSNYREAAIGLLAPSLAAALSLPVGGGPDDPASFEAAWCGGSAGVAAHAGDLALNGRVLVIAPTAPDNLARAGLLARLVFARLPPRGPASKPLARAAVLSSASRALSFFKIAGNVHVYDPETCPPRVQGAAARAILRALLEGSRARGVATTASAAATAAVCALGSSAAWAAGMRGAAEQDAARGLPTTAPAPLAASVAARGGRAHPDALLTEEELDLVAGLAQALREVAAAVDAAVAGGPVPEGEGMGELVGLAGGVFAGV